MGNDMANGDYNSLTDRELLLVMTRDVRDMRSDIVEIRSAFHRYMTTSEVESQLTRIEEHANTQIKSMMEKIIMLERVVYGAVGLMLLTLLGSIIRLVVIGG